MSRVVAFIGITIVIIGIGVGGWFVKRWWNYAWGYESQVQSTVCEMVKPEYLKPGACE